MPLDWDDVTRVAAKEELSPKKPEERDSAYLIVLAGSSVGEMFKLQKEEVVLGRAPQADIHLVDDGISRKHAMFVIKDGKIVVRDNGSTNGTFCNGQKVEGEMQLSDGDKLQFGSTTILKFTFHDSLDESFQRQMYESALRDGLTKIFNRKYFLDRLEAEVAFAKRHNTPLSLLMMDIDHFKKVNDTFGHLAGDRALVELSRIVSTTIRTEDVFARYGGEEFVVVCRGVDLVGAAALGERIRHLVEQEKIEHEDAHFTITVSIGVSVLTDVGVRDALSLIGHADEALYEAKRSGRNKVVSAMQRAVAAK